MILPPYYLEVVLCGSVACIVTVVLYREGFIEVFFESFFKGPRGLSCVFLITCKVPTLGPVDCPTFVFHGVLILGGNQEVFNGAFTLEVGLYACMYLFDAFDAPSWELWQLSGAVVAGVPLLGLGLQPNWRDEHWLHSSLVEGLGVACKSYISFLFL